MNKKRRELLSKALRNLGEAEIQISAALDEEEDCLSNLPENLEGSDRYDKMESAVENLENALSSLEEASNSVENAME